MPPRSKRQRLSRSPSDHADSDGDDNHLVSFLTGYADHHPSSASGSSASGSDAGDPSSDEEPAGEDPDDDAPGAGGDRRRFGLVGSATPRSARTTPKKRKDKDKGGTPKSARSTPRGTPRKGKEGVDDPTVGFIRPTKADEYFHLASRSGKTSNNAYSLLAEPLSRKSFERYLAASSAARAGILPPEEFAPRYAQWQAELGEGFNLLFYGFGSKRLALNAFAREALAGLGHVVVVNGHFPGFTIRDLLNEVEDALGVPGGIEVPPGCGTPAERLAHRIYAHFLPKEAIPVRKRREWPTASAPLYLVIHNIDAPSLRTPKSLALLALLTSSPRIHLIASFDHLHTPLLFSGEMAYSPAHEYEVGGWAGVPLPGRGFNWAEHNLTTYAPYTLEVSYLRMSSLAPTANGGAGGAGGAGGVSEEGALQVLASVTTNAKKLLKLILSSQLSSLPASPLYHTAYPAPAPGGPAPVFAVEAELLKKRAKDKFVALEGTRFEALLGEFRDHGMVVEAGVQVGEGEGGAGGGGAGAGVGAGVKEGRWIWVPLGKAAVERVLKSLEDVVL
ncbi:hypothetical protein IAT38_002411 [Cryptococcus sp. DSM 104549]